MACMSYLSNGRVDLCKVASNMTSLKDLVVAILGTMSEKKVPLPTSVYELEKEIMAQGRRYFPATKTTNATSRLIITLTGEDLLRTQQTAITAFSDNLSFRLTEKGQQKFKAMQRDDIEDEDDADANNIMSMSSKDDLQQLTLVQLRQFLISKGISTKGKKNTLVNNAHKFVTSGVRTQTSIKKRKRQSEFSWRTTGTRYVWK
eukprot:m.25126 g.25126  ORF g.25126 m.25126 type:complete len:203 (+) comp14886_c0_seq1:129-737(+)